MATEIEFRGVLTKTEFKKLFEFLKKKGKFVKKYSRKTFVFHTNDKNLDIKVRSTNAASEIVVKKGFWGANQREEIILPIAFKSVELAKKFLAALGYKTGAIAQRKTHIFNHQGVEFALVECPHDFYYYEAEFLYGYDAPNPEAHVKKILKSLNLKFLSGKQFVKLLDFFNERIDKQFTFD